MQNLIIKILALSLVVFGLPLQAERLATTEDLNLFAELKARALVGSSIDVARKMLMKAYPGEITDASEVKRAFNPKTSHAASAEGFWNVFTATHRYVYYGPGEWVDEHFHNLDETFIIAHGSALVITFGTGTDSSPDGKLLGLAPDEQHRVYEAGDALAIPAWTLHGLIAGPEGLVMSIPTDVTRMVKWVYEFSINHALTARRK